METKVENMKMWKKCEKEIALHICQLHNVHSSPVMRMAKLSGPTAVKIIRNGREKKQYVTLKMVCVYAVKWLFLQQVFD